jgi:hypothetical protein
MNNLYFNEKKNRNQFCLLFSTISLPKNTTHRIAIDKKPLLLLHHFLNFSHFSFSFFSTFFGLLVAITCRTLFLHALLLEANGAPDFWLVLVAGSQKEELNNNNKKHHFPAKLWGDRHTQAVHTTDDCASRNLNEWEKLNG